MYKTKYREIEVAFFMSTFFDAAGAEEKMEKGKTPKGRISCRLFLGHAVKSCMTVIRYRMGRYQRKFPKETSPALTTSAFFMRITERQRGGPAERLIITYYKSRKIA